MSASRAAFVGLRKNCYRSGKGMESEFLCRAVEEHAGRLDGHRRQGIRLGPRGFERIRSSEPGDTQVVFSLRVVRFEIGIADRPIRERGSWNLAVQATLVEIALVKTPVIAGEVNRPAADLTAVFNCFDDFRGLVLTLAKGDGLQLRIVCQSGLKSVLNFIV